MANDPKANDSKNTQPAPPPAPEASAPAAKGEPQYLVVTTRNIGPGELSINGKGYTFTKGQQKKVSEQVKLLLEDAGYLAHSALAA